MKEKLNFQIEGVDALCRMMLYPSVLEIGVIGHTTVYLTIYPRRKDPGLCFMCNTSISIFTMLDTKKLEQNRKFPITPTKINFPMFFITINSNGRLRLKIIAWMSGLPDLPNCSCTALVNL